MITSEFEFRPQFGDMMLTLDLSLLEKSEEWLVKNGCKISYTEDDEDGGVAWICIESMPHKIALVHCKKFDIDPIQYYLFMLSNDSVLDDVLQLNDKQIESIWEDVEEFVVDADNSDWENAVKATANYLSSIQYEFK